MNNIEEILKEWRVALGAQYDAAKSYRSLRPSGPIKRLAEGTLVQSLAPKATTIVPEGESLSRWQEYTVQDVIGEGGMGTINQAVQDGLRREVAIKTIKRRNDEVSTVQGSISESTEERTDAFVSEALVTGFLDHPNIVPVYALGQDPKGKWFFSMKLVRGTAWSQLLHPDRCDNEEKKPKIAARGLSVDDPTKRMAHLEANLKILLSVCNAVAFAHSKNIIHRDLKPENVMVGAFGEVLVMDWGLAVDVSETPPPAEQRRVPHKSEVGTGGTANYMAPEQTSALRSEELSPATDVFLLGGILHELLTGRAPNEPVNEGFHDALIHAINCPPPNLPANAPEDLLDICKTALLKSPQARFRTIERIQGLLDEFLARHARKKEASRIHHLTRKQLRRHATLLNASCLNGKDSARRYNILNTAEIDLSRANALDETNTKIFNLLFRTRYLLFKVSISVHDLFAAELQYKRMKNMLRAKHKTITIDSIDKETNKKHKKRVLSKIVKKHLKNALVESNPAMNKNITSFRSSLIVELLAGSLWTLILGMIILKLLPLWYLEQNYLPWAVLACPMLAWPFRYYMLKQICGGKQSYLTRLSILNTLMYCPYILTANFPCLIALFRGVNMLKLENIKSVRWAEASTRSLSMDCGITTLMSQNSEKLKAVASARRALLDVLMRRLLLSEERLFPLKINLFLLMLGIPSFWAILIFSNKNESLDISIIQIIRLLISILLFYALCEFILSIRNMNRAKIVGSMNTIRTCLFANAAITLIVTAFFNPTIIPLTLSCLLWIQVGFFIRDSKYISFLLKNLSVD